MNNRASVSVEVGLAAPLLILMTCGVLEVTQYIRAQQKLSHAADVLALMVATSSSVSSGQSGLLADLCKGSSNIVKPFEPTSFSASIASISNVSGNIQTDWNVAAFCYGGSTSPISSQVIGAARSLVPNSSDTAIIVSADLEYKAVLNLFITTPVHMVQIAYARPRDDHTIACIDCP